MAQKDVIYLDIEDDITSAIGKFKKSGSKIVALVPPKRTTMLTSVVNLRLLKKAADDSNKKLVLITTDDTLRALAGGLGLYVAKNLTTAPEVPVVENRPQLPSDVIEDNEMDTAASASAPTKEEAGDAKVASVAAGGLGATIASTFKKLKPIKKDKGLPNFERVRKRVIIALLILVVLLGGIIWARDALPYAVVNLRGQTSPVTLDQELRFSTNTTEVDTENRVLPAQRKSVVATQEVAAPATGEKNIGNKATGEMTVSNCDDNDSVTFKSGTRFTSGGYAFVATEAFTVTGADFSGGECEEAGSGTVLVEAAEPGDSYNLSTRAYTIQNARSTFSARGENMTGGTTEIIKVVAQEDINTARDKLAEDDLAELEEELATQFEGEVVVLSKTITTDDVEDVTSHNVGDQADEVKIVRTASYSVFAVERSVYEQYAVEQLQAQIDEQQAIVDNGIDKAVYALVKATSEVATLQVKLSGTAGPDVDTAALQQQLTSKGYTEGIRTAESIPGILKADIELSPFWASGMPRRASNIEIHLEIAGAPESDQEEASTEATEAE